MIVCKLNHYSLFIALQNLLNFRQNETVTVQWSFFTADIQQVVFI